MSFRTWLLAYTGVDSPRGDLADDVKQDRDFPQVDDYETILGHLRARMACAEAIVTFKQAWRAYRSSRRQMTEQGLEHRFRVEVERRGGKALKFTSPGWAGAPDRLILLPGGRALFVELKRPGGRLRALQAKRARELADLGFEVHNVSTLAELEAFLQEVIP